MLVNSLVSKMFNEGFLDTELFWLSFGDFITYTVISTVIIAEIGFVIWLLLKWLRKNVNINWSPAFHLGESARRRTDSLIETFEKKNVGPVEVDVKKNIILGSADELSVKMDEVKKGKVKTQKDKLRKFRGR